MTRRKIAWIGLVLVLGAGMASLGYSQSHLNYPEPYVPKMGPCIHETAVPLPEQWQATALMSPYRYQDYKGADKNLSESADLQVGRFVYDDKSKLMRATHYGVRLKTAVDLLITEGPTYVLSGSYDNPTCEAVLEKRYQLPSRVWLSGEAKKDYLCVGNHRIAPSMDKGPEVDWFKQKSPIQGNGTKKDVTGADWFWLDKNGFPTRTMFWGPHSSLPAVIGDYALSMFYEFGPGNDIDLQAILNECAKAPDVKVWPPKEPLAQAGAEPVEVGALIPGLSFEGCSRLDAKPPAWPVEFYMTSFSTAAKFETLKPIPSSVYFRPKPTELRIRLHMDKFWKDALLVEHASYGMDIIDFKKPRVKPGSCASGPYTTLPGPPKPTWGEAGDCQCMGVLEDNPVLSPGRNSQLIGCPLPLGTELKRTMFWMWYTIEDIPQPIVFLQSQENIGTGTGLSLADYVYWHKQPVPQDIFDAPKDCPRLRITRIPRRRAA